MPSRPRPIEELCSHLNEELSSLEKAIISLGDTISPVMSGSVPEPVTEPKFPHGSSTVAGQLQEFCLRVSSLEAKLNEYRNRVEL